MYFSADLNRMKQTEEELRRLKTSVEQLRSEADKVRRSGMINQSIFSSVERLLNSIDSSLANESSSLSDMARGLGQAVETYRRTERRILQNGQEQNEGLKQAARAVQELLSKFQDWLNDIFDQIGKIIQGVFDPTSIYAGDPVNMSTGSFVDLVHEISIRGVMTLEFSRCYNSIFAEIGPLGAGWSHNYETRLWHDGDALIIRSGLGSMEKFLPDESGKYHSVYGSYESLTCNEEGYLYRTRSGMSMVFDSSGKLLRQSDAFGNAILFAYDEDRLVSAECNGASLRYFYKDNRLVRVEDHTGRAVTMDYVEELLTQVTSPDGSSMSYTYGEDGRIAAIIGKNGVTRLQNAYDEQGRVTHQIFADGSRMSYEYQDDRVIFTDRNGSKTEYIHDERMRPTETVFPDGTERFEYNEKNERIQFIDKLGSVHRRTFSPSGDILSYTDPLGNELRMAYDSSGHLIEEILPNGGRRTREYNEAGLLSAMTDPEGNRTAWQHTPQGKVSRVVSPDGVSVSYRYDERGNLVEYVDERGVSFHRDYDELNRIIAVTDGRGLTYRFRYDDADRVVEIKNPAGQIRTLEYTPFGKLLQDTDFDGYSISYTYDEMERVISFTDKAGHIFRYEYDNMGNRCTVTNPDGGVIRRTFNQNNLLEALEDPQKGIIHYQYDSDGHRLERTMGEQVIRYEYDSLGRMISMTNPRGGRRSLTYDSVGNVTGMTDEMGGVYRYAYDAAGRCVSRTDPNGYTLFYTHTPNGKLASVRDQSGKETKYTYYPGGLLQQVDYPNGGWIRFRYNENGSVIERAARGGYVISYAYDELERVNKLWDNRGNQVRLRYDVNGNLLWRRDARGGETHYDYSPTGKLCHVEDSMGHHAWYSYDAMDRLSAVLHGDMTREEAEQILAEAVQSAARQNEDNQSLRLTVYQRDYLGQITLSRDAMGRENRYEYNSAGQLILHEDPEGFHTRYAYDAGGAVSRIQLDDGRSAAFSYDAMARMTRMEDWSGIREFAYDPMGRLLHASGGTEGGLSYQRDNQGALLSLDYDDGSSIRREWNSAGMLAAVSGAGAAASWLYGEDGLTSEKRFGNGSRQQYTFEPTGQLGCLTCLDGRGTFYREEFAYDSNGNPVSRNVVGQDGTKQRTEYRYDSLNRLTHVLQDGSEVQRFEYDQYGNRIRLIEGSRITEYKYNALNQLVQEECLKGDSRSVRTYSYDRRGNLTRISGDDGEQVMVYDCMGKLASVSAPGGAVSSFQYDGMGNRVSESRRSSKDTEAEELRYLFDHSGEIPRVAAITRDGRRKNYAWEGELLFQDGNTPDYFLCGHQGSVLFRESAGERQAFSYDPFGGHVGNAPEVFGYTGLLYNAAAEGYLTPTRTYLPKQGRFAGRDDDRYWRDSSPESLNLYAYCLNNPVLFVDLMGTDCYYFYLPEQRGAAEADRKLIAKEHGIPESEVHLVQITDNQSFVDGWNGMGTLPDGRQVDIDTVVVRFHANPTVMAYGTNSSDRMSPSDIQNRLQDKNVGQVILTGCNSGHADYSNRNIAAAFSRRVNGAPVLASDGTVSSNFSGLNADKTSQNDEHFRDLLLNGDRDNLGWMIYRYDGQNVNSFSIGAKKMTVNYMIHSLMRYRENCLT